MGWVLVPGVLLALSFASLFLYPLAGKKWDEIKNNLSRIHIEKEKNLMAAKGIRYEE